MYYVDLLCRGLEVAWPCLAVCPNPPNPYASQTSYGGIRTVTPCTLQRTDGHLTCLWISPPVGGGAGA